MPDRLWLDDGDVQLYHGDALEVLRSLPAGCAQTCVTSPPYWGLRDYGADGQIGTEDRLGGYIARLVSVFNELRRVLRHDGTVWLNIGDVMRCGSLQGAPWRVAIALAHEGWLIRSEIIWAKRNGLPDGSARDRPDRFHEHIFLLAAQRPYFYDAAAIREDSDPDQEAHNRRYAREYAATTEKAAGRQPGNVNHVGIHSRPGPGGRNKRSVWTTSVAISPGAHTAVFPEELITPCILAGSRPGDIVIDPFIGSGTTALVARKHGRRCIGIDLNESYLEIAARRTQQLGLLGGAA